MSDLPKDSFAERSAIIGTRSTALGRQIAIAVAAGGLAFAAVASLPWMGVSSYVLTLVYYAAYYAAISQSWNLISGLTGYVSFAHGALAGVGTYTLFIAANRGVPLGVSFSLAIIAAVGASFIVGLPSLRIRGIAFTFATLFFQEIMALLVIRGGSLTGGAAGLVLAEIVPLWVPYLLMLAAACVATCAIAVLRRTVVGLQVLAIREDELAAATAGVPTTRYKLALFSCSAAVAGAVGAIHGLFTTSIYPYVVFSVDVSLVALTLTLIGGTGTALGPVVGALFYVSLRELLQVWAPGLHLAALGALIVLTVLFLPGGVVGAVHNMRSGYHAGGR